MSEQTFSYDVFISHSAKDKDTARDLAERLKADGLHVWFDEWEIKAGDMIGLKIEQGLEQSRTLLLIMSANAFASDWVTLERHAATFRDPTNADRRFIPLRLDNAQIKDTLKQFAYVDWRQKSKAQYARLLAGCHTPAIATDPVFESQEGPQVCKVLKGHTGPVQGITLMADGRRAISCSDDQTLRVWDMDTGKCIEILEGHRGIVGTVAVTPDGRRAVSGSDDKTLRVWDLATGECAATLKGHRRAVLGVVITADGRRAVSCSKDKTVRAWLSPLEGERTDKDPTATRYTNAKVLLVGDSGVGKSGLAIRLVEDRFVSTIATDALWATQLKLPEEMGSQGIESEVWLWDFAGQADYRLVHQLFMDETALAVLVFNPQSENPFEGLGQWDRDLRRAGRRPFKKLLVAGRCDRGGLMVSRASIKRFCDERGFTGFIETSAYTGEGCAALRDLIINNIPWDDIPWTASPRIFKLLLH